MNEIKGFNEEYKFLSNFYSAPVPYEGRVYKTAEAAFQAAKSNDENIREVFEQTYGPGAAKNFGRTCVNLRPDWETVKDDIMYDIVLSKFTYNEDLKKMLLDTGDAYLEETNNWNDTYWGVCRGKGLNKLGNILMKVRDELK